MCGITGAVWTDPAKAVEQATLQRMIAVLRHRGPDDEGQHLVPPRDAQAGVALGHRRLSILDVAGGHQPLANEDNTIWIVFNGEIYNYRALQERLMGRGHHFRTDSDTETLVHLYEEEGPEFLKQLNGMFALALWDTPRQLLLLARDRLGKKPLVYRQEPGRLLFASELKSLLEAPGVPREVSPEAIDAYLAYQYVPHPRTIFRGIHKLPPGHLAVYRDDRLEVRPYWQPDFEREEDLPAEEYAGQLRNLLRSSVELRLQSERELGAFLSGGVDSSIIVGLMRELTPGPVRTFSIGFGVPEYDETRYARQVAERFQTIHEEFRVEASALEILPRLAWHYDEPFGDSSAVPTWRLAEIARRRVAVALTGDGGDELFAGYPRYQAVWLAGGVDCLPAWTRRLLAADFWQRLPASPQQKSLLRQGKRFVEVLAEPPERRYMNWISIFNTTRRTALYSDGFLARLPEVDPGRFVAATLARPSPPGRDPITAASLTDLTTYLPCDLMTKVDIASMAHGLECRSPFLDYRVVELAARMPRRLKFRFGRGKRILRETFADLLPQAIQRRSKMGFGVPLDHWFRNEMKDYAKEVLLAPETVGRGYFRPAAIGSLIDEHQQGQFNHGNRLWALLMLELWHRQWVG